MANTSLRPRAIKTVTRDYRSGYVKLDPPYCACTGSNVSLRSCFVLCLLRYQVYLPALYRSNGNKACRRSVASILWKGSGNITSILSVLRSWSPSLHTTCFGVIRHRPGRYGVFLHSNMHAFLPKIRYACQATNYAFYITLVSVCRIIPTVDTGW